MPKNKEKYDDVEGNQVTVVTDYTYNIDIIKNGGKKERSGLAFSTREKADAFLARPDFGNMPNLESFKSLGEIELVETKVVTTVTRIKL